MWWWGGVRGGGGSTGILGSKGSNVRERFDCQLILGEERKQRTKVLCLATRLMLEELRKKEWLGKLKVQSLPRMGIVGKSADGIVGTTPGPLVRRVSST